MSHPPVSRVVEDYVTLIWKAYEWPDSSPSTSELAASLGVTASTVSANLKKLARDGYIEYEPYGSIALTDSGRAIAIDIVRRHRILETFLVRELGLSWDEVHVEADRLEHSVSDLVLARMDSVLGHPSVDPHGDPIPSPDGALERVAAIRLIDAEAGMRIAVQRVSDRYPEVLRYLEERGVTIGATLVVDTVSLPTGLVHVRRGDEKLELTTAAAREIRVRVV